MNKYEMKQKAYQSTLKSRALQVLVYLIDRSNKEGTCFPAIATMSRELHISVSTVKRALRELTESGFVKKKSRFRENNNGQTSNLYILCFFVENKEVKTIIEKNAAEDSKGDKESIPLKQVIIWGEKNILNTTKSVHILIEEMWTKYYLEKILCNRRANFSHILYWPGEEIILIPP